MQCLHQRFATFHHSIEAVDVFHLPDFMKNLPTPKLTVGEQFYQRLLWTYLFGIYSSSTQLICIYFMWHELLARRRANDVISCVFKFINEMPFGRTGAKHIVWLLKAKKGSNVELIGIVTILVSKYVKCFTL